MRKVIISLCILMLLSILVAGCTETKANSKPSENKIAETNMKKSESDIREIAYQSLNENDKKSIIDWKSARVEEYKSQTDHNVGSPNGVVNLKDKDTYKVNFRTNNEGLLGPITIYIDKNSYKALGSDFRD